MDTADEILDELPRLTTSDGHFLRDIFTRFPQVEGRFEHFLNIEPSERLKEAVQRLNQEPRAGWPVLGVPSGIIQSVAGHQADSMQLAFIVAAGKHDPQHVARMMSVHDLAESLTTDFISGGANRDPITKPERNKLERIALALLLDGHSSPSAAQEIKDLWQEYEDGQTDNAIMAHDIDKLELVMQAQFYESLYPDLNKSFTELWWHAHDNVRTPQGRQLLDELTAQHPKPHAIKTAYPQGFQFPWNI